MCTGGRIRLFWGVSPDFMALALLTRTTWDLFLICTLCYSPKLQIRNKSEHTFGTPNNLYIYIYSSSTIIYTAQDYIC